MLGNCSLHQRGHQDPTAVPFLDSETIGPVVPEEPAKARGNLLETSASRTRGPAYLTKPVPTFWDGYLWTCVLEKYEYFLFT